MRRAVGVLVALLLMMVVVIAPHFAGATDNGQNVEPRISAPGTKFYFYATGFKKHEAVGIWLNTPDGRAIDAKEVQGHIANEDGRVDWSWRSPTDALNGYWQSVAFGTESATLRILTFQIQNGVVTSVVTPVPSAPSNAEPKVGAPGTRFYFYATGYKENEAVGIWLNTPDGRVIAADGVGSRSANDDGRVDWSWKAPSSVALGEWQIVAYGVKSGVEQVLTFTVQ